MKIGRYYIVIFNRICIGFGTPPAEFWSQRIGKGEDRW